MDLYSVLLFCFCLTLISCNSCLASSQTKSILWAWKRHENLSYINPSEFSVAYLACHATLNGTRVHYEWRNQPLEVPAGTELMPVLRIDVDHRSHAALSDQQLDSLLETILKISRTRKTKQVQIDFDALQDERPFYRKLASKARQVLPQEISISITSLASWCLFDNWLSDLPVQETVPMMFSLGKERSKILSYFKSNREFLFAGCCKSLGVSIDDQIATELMIDRAKQRKIPVRIYFFSRTPWTESKIETVRRMLANSEK